MRPANIALGAEVIVTGILFFTVGLRSTVQLTLWRLTRTGRAILEMIEVCNELSPCVVDTNHEHSEQRGCPSS